MTDAQQPQQNKSSSHKWRVSRRGFLIGFGATAVTATTVMALGTTFGVPQARLAVANVINESGGASPPRPAPLDPDIWFEVDSDNQVRFFVPRIEMGQGTHTSLTQIAADELEVAWEQISAVQANSTKPLDGQSVTGNSDSVSALFIPIRETAATLRELMKAEAATQLGVAVADLVVNDGIISVKNEPSQQITYGELVQFAQGWEVPESAPQLKPSNDFKLIGKPMPRVDFKAKLTAQARYGYDMRLPNMLYGAVARPKTIEGKMKRASVGEAEQKPGVVKVVIEDDFAGVVAESRIQAYTGVNNLDIEWDEGKLWQQEELDALVTVGEGTRTVIQRVGDAPEHLQNDDSDVISLSFRTPSAAHAHLEAQAALAELRDDILHIWTSTQVPHATRDDIADTLGRAPETVVVNPTYLGGGFGRRLNAEAPLEAAKLAIAVGRPVHIGWNRSEEFRNGFFRQPTHHILKGKLDGNGRILAMEHHLASGDSLFSIWNPVLGKVLSADFGAYRGGIIQYDVPNIQTVFYRAELPYRTGPWRGLGLLPNTFAIESFIDEMAYHAGVDPLAFRLNQLPDTVRGRMFRGVLEAVADKAGWGQSLPDGHAQGIALALDANTAVAQIAEVSVENGRIKVHHVTSAIDPGVIINPDGVRAQTEGGIMMGLSSTFFEEISFKDGKVNAANFDGYPLLTMKEAPEIDVILLESGDKPNGVGEPPIGPIAAAVGNAYFALTGERLTQLPLRI